MQGPWRDLDPGPLAVGRILQKGSKTDEVFKDQWFHSGDIGVVAPDGSFMIVDRVKNLVKLKGGEYIAIEAMEKEYSRSPYVNSINGGLLCYGDGDMDRPVAFVQANGPELERWGNAAGINFQSLGELCQSP